MPLSSSPRRLLTVAHAHADTAGVAGLTLASLLVLLLAPVNPEEGVSRHHDALAVAFVLLSTVPLLWRRQAPVTVAALVVCVSLVGSVRGYAVALTTVGALVGLASAAYLTDRRRTVALGVFTLVALITITSIAGGVAPGPATTGQRRVSTVAGAPRGRCHAQPAPVCRPLASPRPGSRTAARRRPAARGRPGARPRRARRPRHRRPLPRRDRAAGQSRPAANAHRSRARDPGTHRDRSARQRCPRRDPPRRGDHPLNRRARRPSSRPRHR